MNAASNSAFIFLAGMGTSLGVQHATAAESAEIPDFWDNDKLVPRIREAGLPATFLVFSYRGIRPGAPGGFEPAPYSATHTMNHHIAVYVDQLHRQISGYGARHPKAQFHLIGHSEGGLIAFAYLARLAFEHGWRLPAGGSVASVVTLDAPLGGIACKNKLYVSALRAYLALAHRRVAFTSFNDLLWLHDTAAGRSPLGGSTSVEGLLYPDDDRGPQTNQQLAGIAQQHGVRVLTIGNARDYCYAPGRGVRPFISTQWLADQGPGSGVYGRWVAIGRRARTLTDVEINHGVVLADHMVHNGILEFLAGRDPEPLLPAPNAASLGLWLARDGFVEHRAGPTLRIG